MALVARVRPSSGRSRRGIKNPRDAAAPGELDQRKEGILPGRQAIERREVVLSGEWPDGTTYRIVATGPVTDRDIERLKAWLARGRR